MKLAFAYLLPTLAKIHVSTLVRLESAGWKVAPGNATTIDRVLDVWGVPLFGCRLARSSAEQILWKIERHGV